MGPEQVRTSLLVLYSYHHHNTEKVARVFAEVLDATIKAPEDVDPEELQAYDLIGFGSGISSAKHHTSVLELADRLPQATGRRAFIFSTCGAPEIAVTEEFVAKNHSPLRERLQFNGYRIVDEFCCVGHNTNSFLRFFGGINKHRPSAEDLKRAREFALSLRYGE